MTLRLRARRLSLALRIDAKLALHRQRRHKKISRAEAFLSYKLARAQINNFLLAVVRLFLGNEPQLAHAFGGILPSEELLETRIVGSGSVEIANTSARVNTTAVKTSATLIAA